MRDRVWDAVVVGAGPAGTFAAEQLEQAGRDVLLLDAGPRLGVRERTPEVDRRAWAYRVEGGSFDWYRVRAVGGRALLWGAWCHRLPDVALRRGGFPWNGATLDPWYRRAERALSVVDGNVDARYRKAARALSLQIAPKRGALVGRRVWTPLARPIARRARPNLVALNLEHEAGRARALTVLDLARDAQRTLRARAIVLAASPIETTRILLASALDDARGIGRGLVDHMVASYLLLEPAKAPSERGRGPFPGSALAHGLANTSARNRRPYPGGISVELSGPVPLETLDVERMVPGDEVERWSATQLHAIGELFPNRRRFVDLSPDERDALGRPVPRIHLHWSAVERRMATEMRRACIAIGDAIALPGSKLVPFVDPLNAGAGHEAGTCAMGDDERAPCDAWGRLRALENVWIADASAMPTAGDRHPTLTLIAHAMRVGQDVARRLARSDGSAR